MVTVYHYDELSKEEAEKILNKLKRFGNDFYQHVKRDYYSELNDYKDENYGRSLHEAVSDEMIDLFIDFGDYDDRVVDIIENILTNDIIDGKYKNIKELEREYNSYVSLL